MVDLSGLQLGIQCHILDHFFGNAWEVSHILVPFPKKITNEMLCVISFNASFAFCWEYKGTYIGWFCAIPLPRYLQFPRSLELCFKAPYPLYDSPVLISCGVEKTGILVIPWVPGMRRWWIIPWRRRRRSRLFPVKKRHIRRFVEQAFLKKKCKN